MIDMPPPIKSDDQAVFEVLGEYMRKHKDRYPFLRIEEYSQDNPLHQLNNIIVKATPRDNPEETRGLCEVFQPGFNKDLVGAFQRNVVLLQQVAEALREGKNIVLMTAHESLMDIVLVSYALNAALLDEELIDHSTQINNTEIILGRTIASLGVEVGEMRLNALDLISQLGNLHLTLPATNGVRDLSIDQAVRRKNNELLTQGLLSKKRQGGKIFCVAAPGTVDRQVRDMEGNLVESQIQPVSDASAKLVAKLVQSKGNPGYVLPVAAALSPDNYCCEPGELQEVVSLGDVQRMMQVIADMRHQATGIPTTYLESSTL